MQAWYWQNSRQESCQNLDKIYIRILGNSCKQDTDKNHARIMGNSRKWDTDKILDKNNIRILTRIISESWVIFARKILTRIMPESWVILARKFWQDSWKESCQNLDKNYIRILGNSCKQDTDKIFERNNATVLTIIISQSCVIFASKILTTFLKRIMSESWQGLYQNLG